MSIDIQSLSVGHPDEVALRLLAAFVDGAPPAPALEELQRFLWNAQYGLAIPLGSALQVLRSGRAGDFVYHQRSQLLFTGVCGSGHQLLMAYLAALNRTDFSRPMDDWGPDCIYDWNAHPRLADEFIESGFGLYRSSQHAAGTIRVAPEFAWTAQEKRVFSGFRKQVL